MKKSTLPLVGAAITVVGLAACDAAPPQPDATPAPTESATPTAADDLDDIVRKSLVEILRDPDPYARARRLGTLLPTLGPESVSAVKEILGDRSLDPRASELELLLRYWASYEPAEALLWAKERSRLGYREAALFAALSTWAEADGRAAAGASWGWVVESKSFERILPIALIRGWYAGAAGDTRDLTEFMRSLPIGIPRQRALSVYLRVAMENDGADAATAWASSLPDESEDDRIYKLEVFRRAMDRLSILDLDAGLRWCEEQCYGPYGDNLRSIIARNWVLRDGPAALAWLAATREDQERELAIRLSFGLWADRDREAAFEWFREVTADEPPAWLAPTYPAYARLLSGEDPVTAIAWAGRIEHDAEREQMLVNVARVWRYLDEDAADEWLLTSPLSEEAREKARLAPKRAMLPPP